MPIHIKDAVDELKRAYPNWTSERFGPKKVAEYLCSNESAVGKKLRGDRAFNTTEKLLLTNYFALGKDGIELFELPNKEAFREALKAMGIGAYSDEPAEKLCHFLEKKQQACNAELDFFELKRHSQHLGFSHLPDKPKLNRLTISEGASTRFRFRRQNKHAEPRLLVLLDHHIKTNTFEVLCPAFSTHIVPTTQSEVFFPIDGSVRIHNEKKLEDHSVYGLAATEHCINIILEGINANAKTQHGRYVTTDELRYNSGEFELAHTTIAKLLQILEKDEHMDCAVAHYHQISRS